MMTFNFDEPINRLDTDCLKYDGMERYFSRPDAIPMWVADMDFKTAPCIIDALKKRLDHEVLGYSFKPERYFNSIINWMQKRHNWHIKKEWITFSPGVVAGFTLAIEHLTRPGDKIIVQPPVYFPFFSSITDTGRQLVHNPLKLENGRMMMDFEDLKSKITPDVKMILISNPHNPGGSVWSRDELRQLGELCVKNQVIIISDEIHSDLIFRPNKHVPLASISEEIAQNTITLMAPSKTFNVAGLTTSLVVISNHQLLNNYNKGLNTAHLHMGNIFGTESLIAAYSQGELWLEELLNYLKGNVDMVSHFIQQRIPKLKVIIPEATYLIWIDCRETGLRGKDLLKFFVDTAGVALNEGSMFGPGGDGFVRMNVGCTRKTVEEALARIEKAFNSLTN